MLTRQNTRGEIIRMSFERSYGANVVKTLRENSEKGSIRNNKKEIIQCSLYDILRRY